MQRKNTPPHTRMPLGRVVQKGTARETYGHTTVLQVVSARHSNFGKFWVAPRITFL